MAELTQKERLQPALLDRLRDDAPDKNVESRELRVLSMRELRKCVIRDLMWLLNAGSLMTTEDLSRYPDVEDSVLNYGIPDLSGSTASTMDAAKMEKKICQAIIRFEPRILSDTIQVRLRVDESLMNNNVLSLEIEGELWSQPLPLHLFLKTQLDLESGTVELTDFADSGKR